MNYSLYELIETMGAKVQIKFHWCKNKEEAFEKLEPFFGEGEVEELENDGTCWLTIDTKNVQYTAFYDKEDINEIDDEEFITSEPIGVTSNELKMKDAGHKWSDFE